MPASSLKIFLLLRTSSLMFQKVLKASDRIALQGNWGIDRQCFPWGFTAALEELTKAGAA